MRDLHRETTDLQPNGARAGIAENPRLVDGCDTLPKLFLYRCRTLGGRTAHREKHLGIWKSYSWAQFLDAARAIGLGLAALGLRRGEVVSILSEDNKEWIYADLGIQCMGGMVSGIYPTDSAEQVAFLLENSESRFLFVENAEQLDKFLEIRDRVPEVRTCIVFDREGLHDFSDRQVLFLDDLYGIGRREHERDTGRLEREAAASRAADTAILIYTSGTTGPPKGAMISHENIICSAISVLGLLDAREGDEQLCFLPLCHVLERLVSVFVPIAAKSVVNFAESVETVFDNLREVSPVSFTAVPRVWEKIHSRVSVLSPRGHPGRPLGLRPGARMWHGARGLSAGRAPGASGAGDQVPVLGPAGPRQSSPDDRPRPRALHRHRRRSDIARSCEVVLGDRSRHAGGLRPDREFRRALGQPPRPAQAGLHRPRGPGGGEWR